MTSHVTPGDCAQRLLAIAWIALATLAAGCNREAPKPPPAPTPEVTVLTVSPHDVAVSAVYVAQTQSSHAVNIQARVSGFLDKRLYTEGAVVKAGQVLARLRERYRNVAVQDHSRTFNTELPAVLELSFMLDVAETIVGSALRREESRGAHQRTDFPRRDDERFLAHSLVWRNADGSARVDYLPVTVTRWPPAERVYGR